MSESGFSDASSPKSVLSVQSMRTTMNETWSGNRDHAPRAGIASIGELAYKILGEGVNGKQTEADEDENDRGDEKRGNMARRSNGTTGQPPSEDTHRAKSASKPPPQTGRTSAPPRPAPKSANQPRTKPSERDHARPPAHSTSQPTWGARQTSRPPAARETPAEARKHISPPSSPSYNEQHNEQHERRQAARHEATHRESSPWKPTHRDARGPPSARVRSAPAQTNGTRRTSAPPAPRPVPDYSAPQVAMVPSVPTQRPLQHTQSQPIVPPPYLIPSPSIPPRPTTDVPAAPAEPSRSHSFRNRLLSRFRRSPPPRSRSLDRPSTVSPPNEYIWVETVPGSPSAYQSMMPPPPHAGVQVPGSVIIGPSSYPVVPPASGTNARYPYVIPGGIPINYHATMPAMIPLSFPLDSDGEPVIPSPWQHTSPHHEMTGPLSSGWPSDSVDPFGPSGPFNLPFFRGEGPFGVDLSFDGSRGPNRS